MSSNTMFAVGIMSLVLAVGVALSFEKVDPGSAGVKVTWSEIVDEPVPAGIYFVPPGTNIVEIDARVQTTAIQTMASSADLQQVHTSVSLNWQIDPSKTTAIYREFRELSTLDTGFIQPMLAEAVKTATAQYTADELVTNRSAVKNAMQEYCSQRLAKYDIVVGDLNVTNFAFDKTYQDAIESKQVAEQKALAASNDLKRIEVEAKQAAATAQGQADALLIQARAEAERQELLRTTMTPDLVRWEAIQKWDGRMPMVAGENGGSMIISLGDLK